MGDDGLDLPTRGPRPGADFGSHSDVDLESGSGSASAGAASGSGSGSGSGSEERDGRSGNAESSSRRKRRGRRRHGSTRKHSKEQARRNKRTSTGRPDVDAGSDGDSSGGRGIDSGDDIVPIVSTSSDDDGDVSVNNRAPGGGSGGHRSSRSSRRRARRAEARRQERRREEQLERRRRREALENARDRRRMRREQRRIVRAALGSRSAGTNGLTMHRYLLGEIIWFASGAAALLMTFFFDLARRSRSAAVAGATCEDPLQDWVFVSVALQLSIALMDVALLGAWRCVVLLRGSLPRARSQRIADLQAERQRHRQGGLPGEGGVGDQQPPFWRSLFHRGYVRLDGSEEALGDLHLADDDGDDDEDSLSDDADNVASYSPRDGEREDEDGEDEDEDEDDNGINANAGVESSVAERSAVERADYGADGISLIDNVALARQVRQRMRSNFRHRTRKYVFAVLMTRILLVLWLVWGCIGMVWTFHAFNSRSCRTFMAAQFSVMLIVSALHLCLVGLPVLFCCCCMPIVYCIRRQNEQRQSQDGSSGGATRLLIESRTTTTKFEPESSELAQDDRLCAICLCDYESGEELSFLPCAHHFHKPCVCEWLAGSKSCPMCKHCIEDEPVSSPRMSFLSSAESEDESDNDINDANNSIELGVL
jgi:Ring finger domain